MPTAAAASLFLGVAGFDVYRMFSITAYEIVLDNRDTVGSVGS
jgi:hypothetical protein